MQQTWPGGSPRSRRKVGRTTQAEAALQEPELASQIRLRAFSFLEEQQIVHGELLPYSTLIDGFSFEGRRVPLISPRGIFIPGIFRELGLPETPLTFNTTAPKPGKTRPYADGWGPDRLLRYYHFSHNPDHRDNAGLRQAMLGQIPLIYLEGVLEGRYRPYWPVFLVAESSDEPVFLVSTEDLADREMPSAVTGNREEAVREYTHVMAKRREHQRTFRGRVLMAYGNACSICRIRHRQLLDAAHILPDSHPKGEPWVSNGLAMCKIHHAAFDAGMIGVRPDLKLEVRKDLLSESDGPMLIHGIQECHDRPLSIIPEAAHLKPRRDFLEERYESFRRRAS